MKLAKVEIQAFRAYDKVGDATFDFRTESGTAADFVSIFAPNGFGKTSFYDALEWLFTDKIRRINVKKQAGLVETDNRIDKDLRKDFGRAILRNKLSSEKDETFVRAIMDGGKEFVRKLPKTPKNMTDLSWTEEKPYIPDFWKCLLEQEAIDNFLMRDTPMERYQEWNNYFGKQDIQDYLDTIGNLLALNGEKIEGLHSESQALRSKGFEADREKLVPVNELVAKLKSQGSRLRCIDESFSTDKWLDFQKQVSFETVETAAKITAVSDRCNDLELAIGGNDSLIGVKEYVQIPKKNDKFVQEKGDLQDKLKVLRKIEGLRIEIDGFIEMASEWLSRLAEFTWLRDNYSKFEKIEASIEANEGQVEIAKHELAIARVDLYELSDKRAEFDQTLAETTKSAEVLLAQIDEYPGIVENLKTLAAERKILTDRKAGIEAQIGQLPVKTKNAVQRRLARVNRAISQIKEGKLTVSVAELDPDLSQKLVDLQSKEKEIESRQQQLAQLDARIAENSSLNTDIEKLLALGLTIITSKDQNICPLCSHQFKSASKLLDRVKRNSLVSEAIGELAEERKHTTLLADRSKAERVEMETELLGQLDIIKDGVISEIEICDGIEADLKTQLSQIETELLAVIHRSAAIETALMGLTPARYIKHLQDQHKKRKQEVDLLIDLAKKNATEFSEQERLIGRSLARIDELGKSSNVLSQDPVYVQFSTRAYQAGFQPKLAGEQVIAAIAEVEQLIAENRVKISDLREQIKTMQVPVRGLDVEGIEKNLNWLEVSIERFTAQKNQFETFISNHLWIDSTPQPPVEKQLRTALREAKSELRKLTDFNNLLKKVESMKEIIEPFLVYWDSRKRLGTINMELSKRSDLGRSLNEEKGRVAKSIKKSISNFFHEDLINRLYRTIDPHPLFKRVRFESSFEDRKPSLDVLVAQEDGEGSIVPNLYYSAAQINVLSVSIFLARTLKARDAESRPFEWIFVDDPVQSMDSINVLSTIDLLRSIVVNLGKQVILATHDENFHNLLKRKMPPGRFSSKFIELETYGKVKRDNDWSSINRTPLFEG